MTGNTDFRPLALWGPPGIGKTALALALANQPEVAAAFPQGRAWVALGPEADMMVVLAGLLRQFDVLDLSGLDTPEARARHLRNLVAGRQLLLVIDDVWQREHTRLLLEAVGPPAQPVFTTRNEELAEDLHAEVIDVRRLPAHHAVAMLADAWRYARLAVEEAAEEAQRLADEDLGGLPLALHVAGRRLNGLARSNGAGKAVAALRWQLTEELLQWRAGERRPGLAEENPTLFAILDLSYKALPDDAARMAFRQLAVFGAQPDDFGAEAMTAVWDVAPGRAETLRGDLLAAGLLEQSPWRMALPVTACTRCWRPGRKPCWRRTPVRSVKPDLPMPAITKPW